MSMVRGLGVDARRLEAKSRSYRMRGWAETVADTDPSH